LELNPTKNMIVLSTAVGDERSNGTFTTVSEERSNGTCTVCPPELTGADCSVNETEVEAVKTPALNTDHVF
jgi:hypothetical protein